MEFVLVTFGMRNRVRPAMASLPVKVNCMGLRDPYHVQAFQSLVPSDTRCEAYVRSTPKYSEFIKLNLSKILAGGAMKGGPLRAGVFCGHGVHRSPVVAKDIAHDLKLLGHKVRIVHY